MPWWFDYAVTAIIDDGHSVRTEFRRGPRPSGGATPAAARAARRTFDKGTRLGVLTVGFDRSPNAPEHPTRIELELASGITPSLLSRFPWSRWLIAADEFVRSGAIADGGASERLSDAMRALVGRPGRRGHHPQFLPTVAERYRELRGKGERAPVQRIAEESGVSRNTAAGWIKQARERGLLGRVGQRGQDG